MPIYKSIMVSAHTQVYLWKVTEAEKDLAKGIELTDPCHQRMQAMKSELHRRAFLSIRHLLGKAGYEDKDLYYNDFGKPHLRDGNHVSITHSNHFTGIIIGRKEEVGIDIERQREKILRIAHKFTPLHEYRTLANTEAIIRKLTVVWGAKESLYKIYGQPGVSFLKHIDVSDFTFDTSNTKAQIRYHGQQSEYHVDFLEFEGFTCVYAQREG